MSAEHILIVDDEQEIADSLADFLSNQTDYRVSKANDGEEALALLEAAATTAEGPIDLMVLDRRMPGLSGLEVLERLRCHPTLKFTRVVMLTGASSNREKVDALSAGADDYITKPYYPQELLARVETILRTQRLEKVLKRQSQQLAALNRASNRITTTLDVAHIPAAAVEGARAILGVEMAALFLWDQTSRSLHCRAVTVADGPSDSGAYGGISSEEGAIAHVFQAQETLCINDLVDDDYFEPSVDAPHSMKVHNLLATPIAARGSPLGVLVAVNQEEGPFGEVDVDLLASLAGAISRALENASLFQKVRARQQELQESHGRLQAVINGILDPIYTIDDAWHLFAVNRQKADEIGKQPEELTGQVCYEVFFDREEPCVHCLASQTLTAREPRNWSVRWIGDDHLPEEWDVHAYPLPGAQPETPSAVVVWQDRTEERRLENSLLQAGKLAAIGQLAAGVAHEINNPLTAINANAQMLRMVIPEEEDMYEAVDLIARAGTRATNVVRGLLDFARQNQYAFETGDMNKSILQAMRLVSYQIKSADIQLVRDLGDDLPLVQASWEHLKTVWLNLLINARDAVLDRPAGREIKIETRLTADKRHVQVLVTDNGVGMSPAEAEHIFEPFYTTKAPGQGTGLGLATCQRIIHQHGGDIEVVTAPEVGTTFVVRLPALAPPQTESREA